MTINLIHFTDLHLAWSAKYRVDNLMETISSKFDQIVNYINQYDVKAGIISGDIFNTKLGVQIPHDLVTESIKLFKKLPIPLYAISGNHDAHMGSTDKHPLNTLYASGVLLPLSPEGVTTNLGCEIRIRGWNHKYDKDVDQFKVVAQYKVPFTIGVVHLALGEQPGFYYQEPQYGVNEFIESDVDIFLNGHIHMPFGPVRNAKGQIFCQPGALRRTNTASDEIDRIPQVSLITLNQETGKIGVKYLPIRAQPGIFREWKKEIQHETRQSVNTFIDKVRQVRTAEDTDIMSIIQSAELDADVKNILMEYLK